MILVQCSWKEEISDEKKRSQLVFTSTSFLSLSMSNQKQDPDRVLLLPVASPSLPSLHITTPLQQLLSVMGFQMMRGRPCGPCCSSSSSSPWMLQPQLPKHPHPPLSGRSICSESLRALALHLLLKRRKYHDRDILGTFASSSGVLQITENKSSSLPKTKVNAERKALDDALDRKTQFDRTDEDIPYWMNMSYTSSNLQYNLLMQNIHALESSLACKDLVMLERDILVHIEQLGALKCFNASMSRATLTQTSHESDFVLPGNIAKFYPETPFEEQNDQVIVRSGKSHERKLKRMRASEKGSRISMKASSRKSKNPRKSTSSQFIAEWKNYPGRRRSIVREQSALLVTIKECANLEKIRENMLKDGQEISYDRWAMAAGVDEAVLKSRLQAGYCCRERLLVTTEWLIKYIARTYTGMGTAFEDLLQAGKMGVLDGAEKFDSQKGCKFSTYVKYWIRKAMLALLAENSGVIQLPVRMESIIRKVKEARRAIRYNTGRNPPDAEIATLVGVSVANVRLARKCSGRVVSLYTEIGVGQNAKFVDVTPDTSLESPDEAIFRRQLRERLLLVLDRLPPREGHVLRLRHGLEDGKCRSLEQIGGIYHVSKEWIRKIEKSAMSKLRNEDVHDELKDFCGF